MPIRSLGAALLVLALQPALAQEPPMAALRPDQIAYRTLYQELVETNTTLSAGSCTAAAEKLAAHLQAAGFAAADLTLFVEPSHPKEGGHANNALPQRAAANVNCRIFPGETVEGTRETLIAAIGDAGVVVTPVAPIRPIARPPPLDPRVIAPAESLVARYFPGVPLIPSMSTGATDGIFLEAIGIPVYGVPGGWGDPDGNGVHGLNERRSVRSVYVGRDFLFDLVKIYADAP